MQRIAITTRVPAKAPPAIIKPTDAPLFFSEVSADIGSELEGGERGEDFVETEAGGSEGWHADEASGRDEDGDGE